MKVHESIDISAPPEQVWAQIADPQAMADWHAKLIEVRRISRGPLFVGERFGTTYKMNRGSNRNDAEAEVMHCEPPTSLVLRHHFVHDGVARYVDETYELQSQTDGRETRVEQTVDLAHAGFPLWLRSLMWCITRFGESRGEGILEPLKRACEP
jgi:uncharacterized protein YndB with AHSA1/START domain